MNEKEFCNALARVVPDYFMKKDFRVVRLKDNDGSIMLMAAFFAADNKTVEYCWLTAWGVSHTGVMIFPDAIPDDELLLLREIVIRSIHLAKMKEKTNGEVPIH
jgi:hypothetical protein